MSGFIEGADRHQTTLFPGCLDDYVAEESAVRVIDVLVDELDLSGLGFRAEANETDRPGYHPATMLKRYIYGYLNRVQSSRRLEREAQRNVALMWLTGRLSPDFKTIADFRKDNGDAIRLVCREFVMLCRKLQLFSEAFVAIDGSKFKAVNNRDRNFTQAKLKRRLQQIDESVERYLSEIASADRQERAVSGDKSQRLKDKIEILKEEIGRLKKLEVRIEETPDHLIVSHEVNNVGHDRTQLSNMAALGKEKLTVVTDRGYFSGEEILACDKAGINEKPGSPARQTSARSARTSRSGSPVAACGI